jgi:hypothetical protein
MVRDIASFRIEGRRSGSERFDVVNDKVAELVSSGPVVAILFATHYSNPRTC